MLTFEKDSNIFNYRVAGIAIYNNRVLVQEEIFDDFWFIPGGRCEFLEISSDALIREIKEEIGVKIYVIRPLYFVENFYFFKEKNNHEISIFYLMEFPLNFKNLYGNDTFYGKKPELVFKWVHLDNLEDLRLYPLFLRKSLKHIQSFPEHIINYDD